MTLRAVIIGAGWAGEGHTMALQSSGVEVVAVCGRTAEPVRAMADRTGITEVRLDWRSAIAELQPDLVSITTPASAHHEIAVAATSMGCHVVCEKPLASNALQASHMVAEAVQAGVKHAYAATSRYAAPLVHARSLIDHGVIGDLREVEAVLHMDLPPLMPYAWIHSLSDGGGVLYNLLPHSLQQILYLTDGSVQSVVGWARRETGSVPVGAPVHDFRQWAPMSPEESAECEWREADADMSAALLASVTTPTGQPVALAWVGSASTNSRHAGYLALYGTEGTLHLEGQPWVERIEYGKRGSGNWEEIKVPSVEGLGSQPTPEPVQDGWNQLIHRFVQDIQGAENATYPTFVDGWLANEVIDIARHQENWTRVPSGPR